jgi:GNAT superfamily N-acetyltransferase
VNTEKIIDKEKIRIKPYDSDSIQDILKLSNRSIATERSIDTWRGNNMTAVLAYYGDNLIGAIPLEKRTFSLGNSRYLNLLWVSGAYVDEGYRNQGIGSAMDAKISEYFSSDFKAVFVYRHDVNSPAFRWYKRMGYYELLPILAFKKEVEAPSLSVPYVLLEDREQLPQWEDKIYQCFSLHTKSTGGFPRRDCHFWSHALNTHYYRNFYSYFFVFLTKENKLLAYALLGKTDLKDGIPRIDILEIVHPQDQGIMDVLYQAIMDVAYTRRLQQVRIQVSAEDSSIGWIRSKGFVNRWQTNILGKLISPLDYFKKRLSENEVLEKKYTFIIKTLQLGEHRVGCGTYSIRITADDDVFTQMLLGRFDIYRAIEQGRLLVSGGRDKDIEVLKQIFPLQRWLYFQIDYI